MKFRAMIAAASVLLIAGCSSGDGDDAASTSTTVPVASAEATSTSTVPAVVTTSPEDAPKLPDAYIAEAIPEGVFGEPVDLGNGVTITVSEPSVAHDREHPWVEVDVRATNAAGGPATTAPGVQLVCSGLSKGGGNLTTESYPAGQPLAAGAEATGTAQLVIPGDGGYGDPQRCLFPAYVRIDATTAAGEPVQRRYDVSEALVSSINDLVAERQCEISPTGCSPTPN